MLSKEQQEATLAMDAYERARNELEQAEHDLQLQIDALYTPETKAKIESLREQFAIKTKPITDAVTQAEAKLKQAVVGLGVTFDGNKYQAQFVKPSVSWDAKSLDGFAIAHPEIKQFRTEKPASVRVVAKKKK